MLPADDDCPAGHGTLVAVVDPAAQVYPAAHSPLQFADAIPTEDPKRPGGHSPLHVALVAPVVAPKYPSAHGRQLVTAVPPALHCPMGHGTPTLEAQPDGQ